MRSITLNIKNEKKSIGWASYYPINCGINLFGYNNKLKLSGQQNSMAMCLEFKRKCILVYYTIECTLPVTLQCGNILSVMKCRMIQIKWWYV